MTLILTFLLLIGSDYVTFLFHCNKILITLIQTSSYVYLLVKKCFLFIYIMETLKIKFKKTIVTFISKKKSFVTSSPFNFCGFFTI
jgi:hypothetical protein